MISIFDNPEYVQRAIEVGALVFVLKDSIEEDLLAALRAQPGEMVFYIRQR